MVMCVQKWKLTNKQIEFAIWWKLFSMKIFEDGIIIF